MVRAWFDGVLHEPETPDWQARAAASQTDFIAVCQELIGTFALTGYLCNAT